ncbi:putative porin [Flexithrix dorotheae]|uniref:putative porin n=1 Tax=Flexithrix dorotheae TaxID=70993 RepID=UPI00037868F2|nr:putative porin [Flexithrix dorotheae]
MGLNFLRTVSIRFFIFLAVLFYCTPDISLGQTNDPFGNNQDFRRRGDDDFPNMLGEETTIDSAKKDEKGRILLEPVPIEKYHTRTSPYIYEQDLLDNIEEPHYFDTTMNNIHRYNYVARNNYMYQDLGTVGTAAKHLYFNEPDNIGTRWGLNAINLYLYDTENIKHYDTKSPFTSWYYIQGGSGRSLINVEHTQNIKPNWNAGFRIQRNTSTLLVGMEPVNKNDRQVDHGTYLFKTRYETKDKKYRLLAHFSNYTHKMKETGGLLLSSDDSAAVMGDLYNQNFPNGTGLPENSNLQELDDLFRLNIGQLQNKLTSEVNTSQKRNKAHLYHQFGLLGEENFQFFHIFDFSKSEFSYTDSDFQTNNNFYPNIYFDPTATESTHRIYMNEMSNTVGVKGITQGLFYSFHLRQNSYNYQFEYLQFEKVPVSTPTQRFMGFRGGYSLTENFNFRIDYEGLIAEEDKGNKIYGELNAKFIKLIHKRITAEPDLMQQYYFGNHFIWNNIDANTANPEVEPFEAQEFATSEIYFPFAFKGIKIKPFAKYTTFDHYIYYNHGIGDKNNLAVPTQHDDQISILQAGIDLELHLGHIHQLLLAQYTQNDNEDVIRMPEQFVNYNFFYEGRFPHRNILSRFGFDVHWHSKFFADAYMPVTQQFHLQNDFEIGNYVLADFYWSLHIKKVTMFLKFANILQGVLRDGYFVTPLYMGQPRQFEFGLNWVFYD